MRFLLGVGLCLLSLPVFAQEKCAFVPYNKHLSELNKQQESEATFEKWMQHKQKTLQTSMRTAGEAASARYVIPVVVHVIHHRGETVGQGANIPRDQILSQLKTLNDDFRALNQTDINKLSPQFKSLVADTEIEFVLAKQDPEGVETEGIVRVASSKQSWRQDEDFQLKALSHWPSDQYLNIYVAQLSNQVLGWAQFPQSDQLEGVNIGDLSEASDGVVIDYRYLGTGGQAASDSKGRTATHEVGHYLGLRHIWGDGGCNVDDFVSDTPLVGDKNQGCPAETDKPLACNNDPAMYENYMDYSGDACMALFTLGQRERMHVVLQSSPRRKELHNSPAKQTPTIAANDAGLRQLTLTPALQCNSTYIPNLEVRNYGNTQVTQVQVGLTIDDQLVNTYTLNTNLAYLESETLQLDPIAISNPGQRAITATITLTNAAQDGKNSNNTVSATLDIPQQNMLPLSHNFEEDLFPFYVVNPDQSYSWELKEVPNGTTANNTAAFINFYDYADEGQRDILASPVFNLTDENYFFLTLSLSHARYDDRTSADGIEIYVATDCSTNLQTATLVYSASGEALATSPATTAVFAPKDASEWSSIGLDLSAYAGSPGVQILIVGVNDYGNNLYLDDIEISNEPIAPLNVTLSQISQPSAVFGQADSPVMVRIKNSGSDTVQSLKFKLTLNGEVIRDLALDNLALEPLETMDLELAQLEELGIGAHVLDILAYNPNGGVDGSGSDDFLSKQFVVNTSQRNVPLRQTFSATIFTGTALEDTNWTSTTPDFSDEGWISTHATGPLQEQASTNFAAAALYVQSTGPKEKWLASPMLNFKNTQAAGLQFWYYAGGPGALSLKLVASLDGGITWPLVLWEKAGNDLKIDGAGGASEPSSDLSWTKAFLNLRDFVEMESVRFAFVATGQQNSAVYVDEIEFSLSDQPTTTPLPDRNSFTLYPNPARDQFKLFFNLEDPNGETVFVEIMSSNGTFVTNYSYPNTINQIYTIDLPGLPAGIYYIRIRSASINTTRKLVLVR